MLFHFKQLAIAALAIALTGQVSGLTISQSPENRGKRSIETRDGVAHIIFEHEATGATLDIVKNSGICETTPGVNQYSGYITVGQNMSMWFWFFEARHNKSRTAPLAMWVNGGPGCSSIIGLFQENGPCQFYNNASTPSLNPYSWNEYANMLYVDEPIGTGFSYGTDTVNSTVTAAPFVWKLLQAFYAHFPEYESREFGLFTESYGGHYGPEFAYYFEAQNKAIKEEKVKGKKIDLIALGINNGWYNAYIQEKEYISFSINNSYFPLINETIAASYLKNTTENCLPALATCNSTTDDLPDCLNARTICNTIDIYYGQYYPDVDPYDIRQPGSSPFPPETYVDYISDPAIMKAIGAKSTYAECSDAAGNLFGGTADSQRNFIPDLSSVVQSGVTTLIWAGDADSVCDWFGGFASVNTVQYTGTSQFANKTVQNYTVGGAVKGTYKGVDNLSWLRVFNSGHEVPAWEPELSLQVFKQTLQKKAIFST